MGAIRGTTIRLLCVLAAVAAAMWLGVSDSHGAKVTLAAGPATEAFDLPIHAEIHGLYAGEHVTVQASSYDATEALWTSSAQFTAGRSGTLNLATTAPDAGGYHIADATGPLWSLRPADPAGPTGQFFAEGNGGFTVWLRVLVGNEVVAQQVLTRSVPTPSQRVSVTEAGFAGALFQAPNAAADTPAVVVIGGSEGGMPTALGAAFQAAGYPALVLGYFREPGLPTCLCAIPLEYFAHAVAWLRTQPGFATRPLVLLGASRGGEAALVLGAYQPTLFDAIVAVSPSDHVNGAYGEGAEPATPAWTLAGQPLTPGPIPVSRIRVPVLLTAGSADAIWGSAASAASVMRQLDATPAAPPHTYLSYSGAGHSVAGLPPDLPFATGELGGTPDADQRAAADAWPRVLAFIAAAKPHTAP